MKSKVLIYAGILLILSGLAINLLTSYDILSWGLILGGAMCKISYLVIKMTNGSYRPGFELLLLLSGLTIFFLGKYNGIRSMEQYNDWFIITGITLKIAFVILFIRKIRQGMYNTE